MRFSTLIIIFILLISNAFTANAPVASTVYLRASIGYGTQALNDLNEAIKDDEQVFQDSGIPIDYETFGGALDLAGEFGIQINSTVSLGLTVSHQKSVSNSVYSDFEGSFSDKMKLQITDVTANLSYWTQTTPNWFFGASAGMGFATAKENLFFRYFSDPSYNLRLNGDWNGDGFVGGVFLGLQHNFPGGALLFGKLGYHFRNLGEFEGEISDGSTTISSPPQNNAGQPLDFDFSGIFARVGLGFSFGGRI